MSHAASVITLISGTLRHVIMALTKKCTVVENLIFSPSVIITMIFVALKPTLTPMLPLLLTDPYYKQHCFGAGGHDLIVF